MEFPILVYKCPGEHPAKVKGGKKYRTKQVVDAESLAKAKDSGWFESYAEANAGKAVGEAKSEAQEEATADNAPPTRAELEQKAKELGIKFDGRTRDHKLAAMIKEAL